MKIVLDSSVTQAWVYDDEQTAATQALLDRVVQYGAVAPSLWRFEIANVLAMAVRRKRIAPDFREEALRDLALLDIAIDPGCDGQAWTTTIRLADLYALTAYDAAYLELAQRLRLPLATLDSALAKAAQAAGVEVLALG